MVANICDQNVEKDQIGITYVESRGVKGAFGRAAGSRVAVLKKALSLVHDGFPHRHRQSHGSGERDEARQEAEDQQDPLLRGTKSEVKS